MEVLTSVSQRIETMEKDNSKFKHVADEVLKTLNEFFNTEVLKILLNLHPCILLMCFLCTRATC